MAGCRKKGAESADGGVAAPVTRSSVDAGRAVDVGLAVDLRSALPEPLVPPWTTASTRGGLADLEGQDIGRLSGELYGADRVVRGVVRARCPAGTFLQVVYDVDGTLQVTPAVPLRFFALPEHPVTYAERPFEVRLDLTEASDERLAGTVEITYDREGEPQTYMSLRVDGAPIAGLLEPRVEGEALFPEFPSCHPTGWFKAELGDGRIAEGMMNATLAPDGNGALVTVPFTAQAGVRLIVLRKPGTTGPYTLDLTGSRRGGGFQVIPEAYFTPELTSAADAKSGNVGEEQSVRIQGGEVDISFGEEARPGIRLDFRNLTIPMLLDGPLHGTTLKELTIDTIGLPAEEYPTPPNAPSWRSGGE